MFRIQARTIIFLRRCVSVGEVNLLCSPWDSQTERCKHNTQGCPGSAGLWDQLPLSLDIQATHQAAQRCQTRATGSKLWTCPKIRVRPFGKLTRHTDSHSAFAAAHDVERSSERRAVSRILSPLLHDESRFICISHYHLQCVLNRLHMHNQYKSGCRRIFTPARFLCAGSKAQTRVARSQMSSEGFSVSRGEAGLIT